jgi:hypothetical protein
MLNGRDYEIIVRDRLIKSGYIVNFGEVLDHADKIDFLIRGRDRLMFAKPKAVQFTLQCDNGEKMEAFLKSIGTVDAMAPWTYVYVDVDGIRNPMVATKRLAAYLRLAPPHPAPIIGVRLTLAKYLTYDLVRRAAYLKKRDDRERNWRLRLQGSIRAVRGSGLVLDGTDGRRYWAFFRQIEPRIRGMVKSHRAGAYDVIGKAVTFVPTARSVSPYREAVSVLSQF